MEAYIKAMDQSHDSATLTPKHIVDAFQRAYRDVYGRDAQVVHMFAEWYTVNGETVHRMTLFSEISRLRDLSRQQQAAQQEQFIQQMWLAEQQARAQMEQEHLAQQQFATQPAGPTPQLEPQPVQPQHQLTKSNPERSMIQRLIARLRGA